MTDRIIVDGFSFTSNGNGYYRNTKKRTYLHRYIWEKANGKIPEGYEIHHIDHDKKNNDLSNLQLISVEDHRELHAKALTEEARQRLRDNLELNARPKAIEWHKSEEGRAWHKQHYEATKENLHKVVTLACIVCNNEFTAGSNGRNKFCSNNCKSKYRREQGLDNVVRVCVQCGKEFTINKYRKTVNCTKSCAAKSRLKDSPNLHE